MFLNKDLYYGQHLCLPRPHGGVSGDVIRQGGNRESSPSPRGCFRRKLHQKSAVAVFPVPTGVFPRPIYPEPIAGPSSPSPRGCFYVCRFGGLVVEVFPVPTGAIFDHFADPIEYSPYTRRIVVQILFYILNPVKTLPYLISNIVLRQQIKIPTVFRGSAECDLTGGFEAT